MLVPKNELITNPTKNDLIIIFEKSYSVEFNTNFQMVDDLYQKANDKKYALEYGLSAIVLLNIFRNGSQLDKEIAELYEHYEKLGSDIADLIIAVPDLVEKNKMREEESRKNNKNEINVEFKKVFGIPYGIKQVNIEGALRIGSTFENTSSVAEIAEELGKQRAIIDLLKQLKLKYIKEGGLSELVTDKFSTQSLENISKLKSSLTRNDLAVFFELLQSFLATLSYDMKITEGYFHSHIHLILKLLDFDINSEVQTNQGRIDSVVESERYIHIIEFKRNDSSVALEQILKKKYYQKYLNQDKIIVLVGVAVDVDERNIKDWKMSTL